MQPADHVKFRGAFAHALFGALVNFFERKSVSAGRVGIAPERAQFAVRHANIGGIDVPVDVEVSDVSVALFAHMIREPAHRQKIRRAIQRNPSSCDSRSPAKTLSAIGFKR